MTGSLIIINPNAGGGRAVSIWQQHQDYIREKLGQVESHETQSQDEVPDVLHSASRRGITRVISIGGDGTNHHSVNAIVRHNQAYPHQPLTYATIPAGTGRDWSRGVAMPLDVQQAVDWIANTRLRYVDVGCAQLDGVERLFLNASSVGITSEVLTRVESASKGGRATFLKAILGAILAYRAIPLTIEVDDAPWWDGPVYLAAVANGRYFGQGLKVAPDAECDDALFDLVAAGAIRIPSVLRLLIQMYSGRHIYSHHVKMHQGSTVKITSPSGDVVGLDLDGEGAFAHTIRYSLLPKVLGMHT